MPYLHVSYPASSPAPSAVKPLSLLALVAVLSACLSEPAETASEAAPAETGAEADLGQAPPGAEQLVIQTEADDAELGLTDQVLFFRYTDAADEAGPLAGAVMDAVNALGGYSVQVPLADVTSVRYEDGRLWIETAGEGQDVFEDSDAGPDSVYRQFAPDDARQFAETFERLTSGA